MTATTTTARRLGTVRGTCADASGRRYVVDMVEDRNGAYLQADMVTRYRLVVRYL